MAKRQGGKLFRYEQSFWGAESIDDALWSPANCFSHQLVEALVRNGVMRFTAHEQGARHPVPVEAELIEGAA